MKSRIVWYALVVCAASLTTGCCHFRQVFPHVGWRLQNLGCSAACGPCAPACGPACPPVCSPPVSIPAMHRPPVVVPGGPDCVGCNGGGPPVVHQPAGYPAFPYPQGGYPPVIGNPTPLPGATVTPPNQLHSPMAVPKGTGN